MLDTPTPDLGLDLLHWFSGQARSLPWRDAPCGARDPYKVWLAEIMLQQTTVAAVIPYFETFLDAWPDVKSLAGAKDDDVMRAWAGLGYYARARNMLKCARVVADERQGAFPRTPDDLIELPGVGDYTACAVAAMAFNADVVPVDGNVIRTISRLYALDAEMPANKAEVARLAQALLPGGRGGDFAEALMDLGATVCRPKNPDCPACPWTGTCRAQAQGQPTAYPKKAPKKPKPVRRGWAFWVERQDGRVLLERRPAKGLLGGMMAFPTTPWDARAPVAEQAVRPWAPVEWDALDDIVRHTFTHFHLELGIVRLRVSEDFTTPHGRWCAVPDLNAQGLPSVMAKVVALVVKCADSAND